MTARAPAVAVLTAALALAPLRAAQAQLPVVVPTWEAGTTLSRYATNSTSPVNPARCAGALIVTSPDGDSGVVSHRTRVVLDVLD